MRSRTAVLLLGLSFPSAVAASDSAPSSSSSPPAEAVIAEVPFLTGDEANRILINLAPDRYKEFRMIVDTGATDSVLTPRYAEKLGVIVRRTKDSPYRQATRLGRDLQFWVDVSSSDTASKTGWEYGLLGGTFLREYVVELDFAGRRVRFIDPERYRVPERAEANDQAVVPIKVVGNRPIVPISIGTHVLQVLLDTGTSVSAVFSGAAARQAEISSTPLPGLGAGTVWGPMQVEFAEADSMRVGSFELTHVPLLVAPKGWYNMGSSTDSVIGYDVLSQFVVRIDYPHQRLWLQRQPDAEVTYGGISYALQRRAGLLVYSRLKVLDVWGIFPDAPAARLGIRPGDILEPPPGEKLKDWESRTLEDIAAGKEITVLREMNGVRVDVPLPSHAGDANADSLQN